MATIDQVTSDEGAYKEARKEVEERYQSGATLASLEEYAEHLPLSREERDSLKLLALSITSEPLPRSRSVGQIAYGAMGYRFRPMRALRDHDPLHGAASWDDD